MKVGEKSAYLPMKWAKLDEKMFVGESKLVKPLKKYSRLRRPPSPLRLSWYANVSNWPIYKRFITIFADPPIIYICMNMEYGIWSEIHIFKNWYKNVSNPRRKSNLGGLFNLNQKIGHIFRAIVLPTYIWNWTWPPPKKISGYASELGSINIKVAVSANIICVNITGCRLPCPNFLSVLKLYTHQSMWKRWKL